MPDTLEAPVQTEQVNQTEQPAFNPFKDESWSETPPTTTTETAPVAAPVVADTPVITPSPASNEEVIEEGAFLKSRYGWESADAGMKELEELRALKGKTFVEFDDNSRKIYDYIKEGKEDELYSVLDTKRKVNRLLTADINDTSVKEEIVKLSYLNENKELTQKEVDFMFRKRFAVPSQPVQSTSETDEEFELRTVAWKELKEEKEMDLSIEAKRAKPSIEKLKTELVLPDIPRNAPEAAAPTPESLAELQKIRDGFLAKLNSNYSAFKGYETKVKDESVELPVSFAVPDEDKAVQRKKVEDFEMDTYFNKRWFDENNNPNVEKIMSDLYLLENHEKIFQGIANNAANQRLAAHIKLASNINVTNGNPPGSMASNTTENNINQQIEYIWKQR